MESPLGQFSQPGAMFRDSLYQAGVGYINGNFGYFNTAPLKSHFKVSNSYILRKIKILLAPFLHTYWIRQKNPLLPPIQDINSPDMYMPTMCFISYLVGMSYLLGRNSEFTPDTFSLIASFSLFLNMLEIVIMRLALYFLDCPSQVSIIDVFAYSGYKYFGLALAILAGVLFGKSGYYIVLLYSSFAIGYFLYKSLLALFMPLSTNYPTMQTGIMKIVVLGLFLCQPPLSWLMGPSTKLF